VEYESVVITDERERWLAAGSPAVPTLTIDGAPHVLQHPSQAGVLLGLATPPALRDAWHVAWHIAAVLEAWLELVTTATWNVLREPIPVLDRTPLALAVDTSIGIAALPDAFSSGWFHWPGNPLTGATGDGAVMAYEASIVEAVHDRHDLLAFVRPVAETWSAFLFANEQALRDHPDRPVRTPRGGLPWVGLLEAQRLHAAQHYRQAATFLSARGQSVPDLDVETLDGLTLPKAIY
jgi:hypothetical protein